MVCFCSRLPGLVACVLLAPAIATQATDDDLAVIHVEPGGSVSVRSGGVLTIGGGNMTTEPLPASPPPSPDMPPPSPDMPPPLTPPLMPPPATPALTPISLVAGSTSWQSSITGMTMTFSGLPRWARGQTTPSILAAGKKLYAEVAMGGAVSTNFNQRCYVTPQTDSGYYVQWESNGNVRGTSGNADGSCGTFASGDVVGFALDLDANQARYYRNGALVCTRPANAADNDPWFLLVGCRDSAGQVMTVRQGGFTHGPPAGYAAWG